MMLCKVGKESDISKHHLKWLGNQKFDGCRCMAICDEQVRLIGRNGSDYTSKFLEIAEELKGFKGILDGEIACLDYTPDLINLWEMAKKENWEGIIIKNPLSFYENKRSWNWLKIKKEITRDIVVTNYEINPAGIRVENKDLACQITGSNASLVKKQIDETGSCKIEVKGLELTKNNKIRQIVFKDIK